MNGRVAVVAALILFFVLPCLFLSVVVGALIPLYSKSSNLQQFNIGQALPSSPPLGIAGLQLYFTKRDTRDTWYTIIPEGTADCNQTVDVTYAFYRPEFNKYDLMTMNMQGNGTTVQFETESYKATYSAWSSSPNMSLHLETYDPYGFPFDVYETPNIIIAFDTYGSNSTHRFIMNGWTLNSEVPSGFSATVSDYKELSENEIISRLGNSSGLENSLALEFKITMLRDKESLLWLSIYIAVPFVGIWAVFAVTQLHFEDEERMQIFAGALLATFAYLLTIRSFTPPTLTRVEVSVIELVGIWAFLELLRGFGWVWREHHKSVSRFESIERSLTTFRPVFFTMGVVMTTSILVYINSFIFPSLYNATVASGQTPWGVFTSLFVHTSLDHLALNMVGLWVFSVLFAATNFLLDEREKVERSIFLLAVAFLMAIFSNAFWVWLIPSIGTAGASGIVFALQGSVLGFALLNSLGLRNIRKEQNRKRRIQLAGFYSFNLVVFVTFFLQIVLAPTIFLNVATAVNVVIHGVAFLGALLFTILWQLVRTASIDIWTGLLGLRSRFRKKVEEPSG
jgi:membrane associated rhomboid family serine protease